ncbi:DNA-primase RepB domain-containing protein [Caballeronia sp. LZ035]|uniref:DNA-primase RepB domain-containing protein n=1 Tax=Caballeronia sp. LZ035 TaxID=3038568 RepID=UPI002862FB23|nr:DNA-primase RepB domain-containing protein [Caballeronia sp. LZ035]MDR5757662.1 DNA-primase RepB domain-containing protein [Caballeronia sp. LZ035]
MNEREGRLAAAEEFLRELGCGVPEDERVMAGYAEEATAKYDAENKRQHAGWWPVPYKNGKYIDSNKNCYVCISASKQTLNAKTGRMRYWRGEESFSAGLALMVDDVRIGATPGAGSKGDLSVDELAAILPPTAVVETSPGNAQVWYMLSEPETDMRRFKAFLVGFTHVVLKKGGDHTIRDVSRYGRMPIGINNKRLSDGSLKYADAVTGKPFLVSLRSADYSRRYSIDSIAAAFGSPIAVSVQKRVERDDREMKVEFAWMRIATRLLAAVEKDTGKYRIVCPWDEFHKSAHGDDSAYFRGPVPGAEHDFVFGCQHDSCRKEPIYSKKGGDGLFVFSRKRTWTHFIDAVVMPQIEIECDKANEDNAEWFETAILPVLARRAKKKAADPDGGAAA